MILRNRAWDIALIGAAVVVGIVLSLRPWHAYREQRSIADQERSKMRAAEKRSDELRSQNAALSSTIGREERAREYGFRREGEIPADAPK
jgi:hypothetical protein